MSSTHSRLHKAFGIDAAHHGDNTHTQFDKNVQLQVIALGLSRTGTTSLQAALVRLGFGPSHQGIDLFRSPPRCEAFIALDEKLLNGTWKAGDPGLTAELRELMRGYRSTTDNPIHTLVDETFAAFPDAKYILTTRPDGPEGWWKSVMDAAGWHFRRDWGRYLFRFLIFPIRFLRRTDDKVQSHHALSIKRYGVDGPEIYDKHNAHVRALVPNKQLLVYDVREGWAPLCRFLDVPVPDDPYPRLNETASMQTIYFGMMTFGACTWILYAAGVAGLTYLAWKPSIMWNLTSTTKRYVSQLRRLPMAISR